MTRQIWFTKLHNASSYPEQIKTLKSLKNAITGHPLVKESIVTQGILDLITKLACNKSSAKNDGSSTKQGFVSRPLDEEELSRLQALQILASISLEGSRFLAPLHSSNILPALLSNICPKGNPLQLILASLRALSNLADSSALISTPRALTIFAIADEIFIRQHLESLCLILSQESTSNLVQSQISIAASLISRICREERHQQSLANSGVLDALAARLASFVVSSGLVIPGAELFATRDSLGDYISKPAPHNADFAGVAEAISVIIANSKLRCSQLLYSPYILAILPSSQSTGFVESQGKRASWNALNVPGSSGGQAQLNWIDYLLPFTPQNQYKISSSPKSAFPILGAMAAADDSNLDRRSSLNKPKLPSDPDWGEAMSPDTDLVQTASKAGYWEYESPLISYLILVIRSKSGLNRLMASAVLAGLYRTGLPHKRREAEIGFMVVPLLVQMLDKSPVLVARKEIIEQEGLVKIDRTIKEMAPSILAMFITDSECLQKAAFDAGVITRFSILLKFSYESVPETANLLPWSPHSEEGDEIDKNKPVCLGNNGQSPLLVHKIKVRESTLKAIAALVPFKDDYRKSIVDQGLMPYIVESLSSHPKKPSIKVSEKSDSINVGLNDKSSEGCYGENPKNVLIAACGAVRTLSRSVSVLRTTLIDNGVAEPVFGLLQHPDIDVQIAATATVINLLTDVSPMRDTIAKAGVLKILCEYAKSWNARLRLNAVWALKHFVQGVDKDMKQRCFEELGHGWLVHLICDDTEDVALISSREKMERSNSSNNEMDEDTEMDQFEQQIDTPCSILDKLKNNNNSSLARSSSIQQAELRLAALRDAELDPARKARRDDIAVQEQGLDFIRNLIGGVGQGGTEASDMIDFLFSAIGQDRIFEILASKLRPKAINPYNRKTSGIGESKVIPPQTEIIIAVSYILVHMAASVPRHRQLVIAQTELLILLVPQFNHSSIEVRLALCWLVTNLTWMDDQTDAQSCAQRANELKKLGFLAKLEMLEQDSELSVRERAKSALWQMKQSR